MSGSTWTWIGGTINVDSSSDWILTAGPGNPTGIPETGDTAINNGTLVGYGLIAANLINNGTVGSNGTESSIRRIPRFDQCPAGPLSTLRKPSRS
jgi:hypothetical protein